MRIHLAVALAFLLSACADDRSITAPPAPSQAAKALALPTASLSPDPATVAFAADSTWHAFAIETTADSLLFEVNPETTDVVLAVAGPDRPEAGGCPAKPTDRIAWTEPSGDSLYVAACGPGRSQVVIRELVYELALTRYQVAVEQAADTLQTPAEEAPFGAFVGLLDTEMVVTPKEETEPTQEEETPTEEPEEPEKPKDDVGDTRDQARQLSIEYPKAGEDGWSTAVGPFQLTKNDVDFFKIVLTKATDMAIASGSSGLDPYGILYDSAGNIISENDDYEDLDFVVVGLDLKPGTYYLKVAAYGGKTGSYFLGISIDLPTTGAGKPTVSSDRLILMAREVAHASATF